ADARQRESAGADQAFGAQVVAQAAFVDTRRGTGRGRGRGRELVHVLCLPFCSAVGRHCIKCSIVGQMIFGDCPTWFAASGFPATIAPSHQRRSMQTDSPSTAADAATPQFARIAVAPAYRLVCQAIEREILEGRLAIGAKLPTEVDLAERFGVNRATVRE